MTIIRQSTTPKVSRMVTHNDTVYLCGQVALDVSKDIVEQTHSTLERIDQHLEEAGTDKSKVLFALIHIKNISDASTFNEIWSEWLPEGCAPARSCVQANMLRDAVLVEVTVTAAL